MRVVYVSDNRCRGNYGCRATSTALSMLIRERHDIVGTVSGRYTNYNTGPVYFNGLLPESAYGWLGGKKSWPYAQKLLYNLHRAVHHPVGPFALSGFDYLGLDLDRSIDNLQRCVAANPHLREYDLRQYDFDAMVVNGEGSFIFATPPWRESISLLMLMYWAEKMGKKVFFLNAMLSDDPYSPRNEEVLSITNDVLSRADVVSVRENESLHYARNCLPGTSPLQYPDALFTWYDLVNDSHVVENGRYYLGHSTERDEYYTAFDFTKPYICISGSSAPPISQDPAKAIAAYSSLITRVKDELGLNIFLVNVCEGDAFLESVGESTDTPVVALDTPLLAAAKILANARLYISGRYHPGILSTLGGTPCVFMSSNSHKTRSLQELIGYDDILEYPVVPTDDSIKDMITRARHYLEGGEALRNKIKSRAKELSVEAHMVVEIIK